MAETKAVQRKADLLPATMVSLIQALVPDCNALLPADITTEQFRAALWLELTGRPDLHDCTGQSLRECVVKAATYGLLPGRDCHFLPFKNRKGGNKLATYVPNYQGLLLALGRTGKVRRAFAHPVYDGDLWEYDNFADRPVHKPAYTIAHKQGPELFYYGAIQFRDGTFAVELLSLEDLDKIRRSSPAHEQGPWVDWPVMMKRKSALKRVAKYVKLTPQIAAMLDEDDQREREDIPAERHQQNIVELFGDKPGPPSQYAQPPMADPGAEAPKPEPWCDDCNTAGHYPEECQQHERSVGKNQPSQPKTSQTAPTLGVQNSEPARGQKQTPPDENAWKQTLLAHRETIGQMAVSVIYGSEARERLEGLLEKIDFALSPLGTITDMQGHALADAVLAWLDATEEGR